MVLLPLEGGGVSGPLQISWISLIEKAHTHRRFLEALLENMSVTDRIVSSRSHCSEGKVLFLFLRSSRPSCPGDV